MPTEHDIQGISPGQVIETANPAELTAAIGQCVETGRKIVDYGSLHRGLGFAPPDDFVRILTPGGVLAHHVQDMTVCVRAATTLHDLAVALAEHNQWLPLDGADDSMTLGEAVAHNHSGPLRLGFGSLRDLLLGMTFVNWQGEEIRVGGRTVKNVAGYDVSRFMVGHLNMMGVVTELIFRTWAIPRQLTRVTLPGVRMDQLDENLTELLISDAAPIYLDHQHTADRGEVLHLGYAGSAKQCAAQFHALRAWLPRIGYAPRQTQAQRADGTLWEDARLRAQRRAWKMRSDSWVKLVVRPGRVGEVVTELIEAQLPEQTLIESLPGHGVVHLGANWSIAQARELDPLLIDITRRMGGLRIWMRRPEHTLRVEPIAPLPPDGAMLQRLIYAIDPRNIFNPGRFTFDEE